MWYGFLGAMTEVFILESERLIWAGISAKVPGDPDIEPWKRELRAKKVGELWKKDTRLVFVMGEGALTSCGPSKTNKYLPNSHRIESHHGVWVCAGRANRFQSSNLGIRVTPASIYLLASFPQPPASSSRRLRKSPFHRIIVSVSYNWQDYLIRLFFLFSSKI